MPLNGPDGETYLRTAEAADILHVGPKTVSRWAKEGLLPYIWTKPWQPEGERGHRRYPESKIRALLSSLSEQS